MPSRKEKQQIYAAERKQKQWAKAMANLTEEQKIAHCKKGSERRSKFKAKEVEHVTQY